MIYESNYSYDSTNWLGMKERRFSDTFYRTKDPHEKSLIARLSQQDDCKGKIIRAVLKLAHDPALKKVEDASRVDLYIDRTASKTHETMYIDLYVNNRSIAQNSLYGLNEESCRHLSEATLSAKLRANAMAQIESYNKSRMRVRDLSALPSEEDKQLAVEPTHGQQTE